MVLSQSFSIHFSWYVVVYQLCVTGLVEPSPDRPKRDVYQTSTVASFEFDDVTLVPTGITREKKEGKGEGGGGGGLHAEQHFEYHRHLRPGDVLTGTVVPGATWEKESRRAGKLSFTETVTEYRDQNGELVITARGVGVTTERPVDQG